MDNITSLLKECNNLLVKFDNEDYSFNAWLTYNSKEGCFVAGVDVFDNNEELNTTVISSFKKDAIETMRSLKEVIENLQSEHDLFTGSIIYA